MRQIMENAPRTLTVQGAFSMGEDAGMHHASSSRTSTPFQKAMRPLMERAFSLGSG